MTNLGRKQTSGKLDEVTLGYLVQDITFSKAEEERLALQVHTDAEVKEKFSKYLKKSDYFKKVSNSMNFPGFRHNTPAHFNKALDEILRDLSSNKLKKRRISWQLYKSAFAAIVINEHKDLNTLLLEVPSDEESKSSQELLKAIARNCHEYSVPAEDLEYLYKIWGFERVPDFSEITSLCSKANSQARVQRELTALKKAQQAVGVKVQELDSLLAWAKDHLGKHEEQLSSLNQESEAKEEFLEEKLLSLTETIKTLESQLSDQIVSIKEGQLELRTKIAGLCSSLNREIDHRQRLLSKIGQNYSEQVDLLKNELEISQRKSDVEHLTFLDSKLEKKLAEFEQKLGEFEVEPLEQRYVSPLEESPAKFQSNFSAKIRQETDFINIWSQQLADNEGLNIALEQLVVYHSLFKASRVLILEEEHLFRSWLRILAWERQNYSISASPHWITEEDWASGAQYLFTKSPKEPRILTIFNFDTALTQCYLIPTLRLWIDRENYPPLSKLVLLSAKQGKTEFTPNLLELAQYLPEADPSKERQFPIAEKQLQVQLGKSARHTGVKPATLSQWCTEVNANENTYSDIDAALKMIQVDLPAHLKRIFTRFKKNLEVYFSEEDSRLVAAYHIILPWLELERGIEIQEKFFSDLKSMSMKPIEY